MSPASDSPSEKKAENLGLALSDDFSSLMTAKVKRLAKYFKQSIPSLKQAAALDGVSRACGQPDWFHLQQAAKALDGSQNWEAAHGFLLRAEALTLEFSKVERPDPRSLAILEAFSVRLAQELATSGATARQVLARSHGERDWDAFRERDLLEQKGATYRFIDTGFGDWRFTPTEVGEGLEDVLLAGSQSMSMSERRLREVDLMVMNHPSFFPAWYHLAGHYYSKGYYKDALDAYSAGIAAAEGLFPSNFRGKITFGDNGSYFYFNLLRDSATAFAEVGKAGDAIKLIKKLLRVNPRDGLGVRYLLPCLYAGEEDYVAATRALRKIPADDDGAQQRLASALVSLSENHLDKKGLEHLLEALFKAPYLRHVMLREKLPDLGPGSRWHRGVIYDIQGMAEMIEAAMPDYVDRDFLFHEVLESERVMQAESRLESMFLSIPAPMQKGRITGLDAWRSAVISEAKEVANFMLRFSSNEADPHL